MQANPRSRDRSGLDIVSATDAFERFEHVTGNGSTGHRGRYKRLFIAVSKHLRLDTPNGAVRGHPPSAK